MEKNGSLSGPSGPSKKRKVMCSKDKFKLKTKKTNGDIVSLLIINDDCLLHIFRYLKIRDVMSAEQTCTRLKDVARLCYSTTKTFEWTSDIPYACAPKIIVKYGRYTTSLKSLHFNQVRKPLVPNIHYDTFIETILDNCKNIKSLKFTKCDVGYEWAPFFDAVHCLESLSLHSTHLRNSNYLKRVSTLKEFVLEGRNSFELAKFNYFLAMNGSLERLVLVDCDNLSRGLRFDILGDLRLKSLSLEVYKENAEGIDEVNYGTDDMDEMKKPWGELKKLKITQKDKNLNLNLFLRKITENGALEKLELFKFHVDEKTFTVLKAMKLESLFLYPKFKCSLTSLCQMLMDAQPNLKHLTLTLFDTDRDLDLSQHDMMLLIERLKRLESLNLHHCESDCGCDYVVCPFRCKLRSIITNLNEIFQNIDRPTLKFILPKRISQSFFQGYRKTQEKYRNILTSRVRFIKLRDIDSPFEDSSGFLNSILEEFLQDNSNLNDDTSDESDSDSETSIESGNDPESHPNSDDDDLESDSDLELDED